MIIYLSLNSTQELRLVGYANDAALLIAGRSVEQAKQTWHIDATGKRMDDYSWFQPCIGEVVILTKNRIPTLRPISFGESIIESAVKYLGLTLDSKMSFFGASALCRLMQILAVLRLAGDVS